MCEQGIPATLVKLAKPRSNGRTHAPVDPCIAPIVQALNDAGIETVASCCGHGHKPGCIVLGDGREVILAPDFDTARRVEKAFPDIQGHIRQRAARDLVQGDNAYVRIHARDRETVVQVLEVSPAPGLPGHALVMGVYRTGPIAPQPGQRVMSFFVVPESWPVDLVPEDCI